MSKTIVITGASSGIGAAAAKQLAANGHRVMVVGRRPDTTKAVADDIGAEHFLADFAKLDDVRNLSEQLTQACERIDVLANNAGGVFGDREETENGFEMTFQVNHLAPFLLTNLLMPKLLASKASVIQTSSIGSRLGGKVNLDDLQFKRNYSSMRAYSTGKLQNILFTRELHRRYHTEGLSAAAFHPGVLATNFGQSSKGLIKFFVSNRLARRLFLTEASVGGARLARFAETDPGKDWVSGAYYEDDRVARRENPQARDEDLARRFWERSEELLGLTEYQ